MLKANNNIDTFIMSIIKEKKNLLHITVGDTIKTVLSSKGNLGSKTQVNLAVPKYFPPIFGKFRNL